MEVMYFCSYCYSCGTIRTEMLTSKDCSSLPYEYYKYLFIPLFSFFSHLPVSLNIIAFYDYFPFKKKIIKKYRYCYCLFWHSHTPALDMAVKVIIDLLCFFPFSENPDKLSKTAFPPVDPCKSEFSMNPLLQIVMNRPQDAWLSVVS